MSKNGSHKPWGPGKRVKTNSDYSHAGHVILYATPGIIVAKNGEIFEVIFDDGHRAWVPSWNLTYEEYQIYADR